LLLLWRFPAFWDEGFLAVQAQTGLDYPATRFSELADAKGPLFNWVSIVFVDAGFSPLEAVRFVSLLAGISTLTTTALVSRRLAGDAAGLVAGALYVALPIFLVHDVHGLVDPLLGALMAAALLLEIQQAERARLDRAFALGLVLGAAVLTRDVGQLALLLLPLSLLCFDFAGPRRIARLARWLGCSLISLALAGLSHAVLYLSPLYYQQAQLHNTGALRNTSRSLSAALGDPFKYVSVLWPDVRGDMVGYIGLPLLVLAAGVLFRGIVHRRRLVLLLALWVLGPFVAMTLFTQFGFPRYFLPAIAPLTALMAAGLVWLAGWLQARLPRVDPRAAAALVALTLIPPLILDADVLLHPGTAQYPGADDYQYAAGWPSGTGLDVIARALNRLAGPGQTVVAAVDFTPWNLAVRFDHPLRFSLGSSTPAQDGAVAYSRGRKLYFIPYGNPEAAGARFLLQHSSFGTPLGLDLGEYHLVASYQRPRGGVLQGHPQPITAVQLYERN
jgi:4-amino-4-deoxy-L-arabinose transferase-like glycosyltransferase